MVWGDGSLVATIERRPMAAGLGWRGKSADRTRAMQRTKEHDMYAVTGITGQVGGVVATTLLNGGKQVRAVVRDRTKAGSWVEKGCEIATADMTDAAALTAALADVEAVFILIPPLFDPAPGFPEIRAITAALKTAISDARPPKNRLPLHDWRAG
jgi:hypothetical protein